LETAIDRSFFQAIALFALWVVLSFYGVKS
jgi:hypothetical protein